MAEGKAKDGQKNFAVGLPTKRAFEGWCSRNNYDDKGVFLAGWFCIMDMTHDQRQAMFERVEKWRDAGSPEPPRAKSIGGKPASAVGGKP